MSPANLGSCGRGLRRLLSFCAERDCIALRVWRSFPRKRQASGLEAGNGWCWKAAVISPVQRVRDILETDTYAMQNCPRPRPGAADHDYVESIINSAACVIQKKFFGRCVGLRTRRTAGLASYTIRYTGGTRYSVAIQRTPPLPLGRGEVGSSRAGSLRDFAADKLTTRGHWHRSSDEASPKTLQTSRLNDHGRNSQSLTQAGSPGS